MNVVGPQLSMFWSRSHPDDLENHSLGNLLNGPSLHTHLKDLRCLLLASQEHPAEPLSFSEGPSPSDPTIPGNFFLFYYSFLFREMTTSVEADICGGLGALSPKVHGHVSLTEARNSWVIQQSAGG